MIAAIMWKIACFLLCLLGLPAFALDPNKAITQFGHTAWTEKDGAPGYISSIAQTTDGYLWLRTAVGLVHFDGVRFVKFEPTAGEHFPTSRMSRLLATRDGSLWVVFDSGSLTRLLNGHLTTYSQNDGLPAVSSLVEDRDGTLIAGTAKGLARFKDGVWKDVTEEWNFPSKRARWVYFDRAGSLWAQTEDRALYLPAGRSQVVDLGAVSGIEGFAQAPDGSIWIAEVGRSAHTLRLNSGDPSTEIRVGADCLLFDRNRGIWIGSVGDGLRRVAHPDRITGHQIPQFGPQAEEFTAKDGLSGDVVFTLFEDREGNIWTGTVRGLDRFRETAFTAVPVPHPDLPKGLLATTEGDLVVFQANLGEMVRIAPGGSQEVMARVGGPNIYEDKSGTIWRAAGAVSRFLQGRFVSALNLQHPIPQLRELRDVNSITGDKDGGLWLLDSKLGLFRYANGVAAKIAGHLALASGQFGWLYADRDDRIWVAEYDRVAVYDHGRLQEFGAGEGVPSGQIFSIYQDRAGNVWAYGEGGMSRYGDGRFQTLSKPNGLPSRTFGAAQDANGYSWIAVDDGVLRVSDGELNRALREPAYQAHFEVFNMLDGLPGHPGQRSPMPIVARTTDGRIWFATTDGPAFVNPRCIPKNSLPPPVHIEAVKVDGKQMAPGNGMFLPHDVNELEIDYTALSLSIPERVLFRYKLEGAETSWHEAGNRRQAFYNNLRPKRYRFRVIACNNDGVWNEAGDVWDFSRTPAFYEGPWFESVEVLAGSGLIWILYRLRLRQMAVRMNLRYTERLAERTRIARDLHDTLMQDLAGVSLQLDGISKQASSPDAVISLISRLRQQVDACFEEARNTIWNLRTRALQGQGLPVALLDLVERLRATTPVRCELTILGAPHPFSADVEEELLLIAQEATNNSIRHAQAHEINVAIEYAGRSLRLQIRDDGRGFDVEEGYRKPGHWGLKSLKERASKIHARCRITSDAGRGTQVEVLVRRPIWSLRSTRVPVAD